MAGYSDWINNPLEGAIQKLREPSIQETARMITRLEPIKLRRVIFDC